MGKSHPNNIHKDFRGISSKVDATLKMKETVSSKTLQMTARRLANGSVLQRTCKCVRHSQPKQFKQEHFCLYSFY